MKMHLFFEFDEYHTALLHALEKASGRIWIEIYKLNADRVGLPVIDLLCHKAQMGVDVKLTVDAIGSRDLPSSEIKRMQLAGIKLRQFHPLWLIFFKHRHLNRRNHKKIFLIDQTVFLGSANLAECSSFQSRGEARWHEINACLDVGIVPRLELLMKRSFIEKLMQPIWFKRFPKLMRSDKPIDVLWTSHLFNQTHIRRHIHRMIRKSNKRVDIMTAYFVPDWLTMRHILRARKRGVVVRILTNSEQVSDVPLVERVNRLLIKTLLRHGVHIRSFPRMMHSKLVIVDQTVATFGSTNINYRSFHRDAELNIIVRKTGPINTLSHEFETCWQASSPRVLETHTRSVWQKFLDRFYLTLRHYF